MIGKFIKSEIDTLFPLVKKNVSIISYINAILSLISDYHSNSIKSWTSRASGRKTLQARFQPEAFG